MSDQNLIKKLQEQMEGYITAFNANENTINELKAQYDNCIIKREQIRGQYTAVYDIYQSLNKESENNNEVSNSQEAKTEAKTTEAKTKNTKTKTAQVKNLSAATFDNSNDKKEADSQLNEDEKSVIKQTLVNKEAEIPDYLKSEYNK